MCARAGGVSCAEPPNVEFDPANPMEYVQATKKGKPAMMFATLDLIKDAKTGALNPPHAHALHTRKLAAISRTSAARLHVGEGGT